MGEIICQFGGAKADRKSMKQPPHKTKQQALISMGRQTLFWSIKDKTDIACLIMN
jgi:hypothetical protein